MLTTLPFCFIWRTSIVQLLGDIWVHQNSSSLHHIWPIVVGINLLIQLNSDDTINVFVSRKKGRIVLNLDYHKIVDTSFLSSDFKNLFSQHFNSIGIKGKESILIRSMASYIFM